MGDSKRNVFSIALTLRAYRCSRRVPVASQTAAHAMPVLDTSRPSQWPSGSTNFSHHGDQLKVPTGLETQRRSRGEVGRTDLLAAAFLRLTCLHGPRTLEPWICVNVRWAHLDLGPSCALSPASMQSSRRPPMRCGESESIIEMVPH